MYLRAAGFPEILAAAHMPNTAKASYESNMPQNEVARYLST